MSSFSIQHFLIRADVIEGYGVYLPKRLEKWTSVFKNTVKQKQQLMQVIHFSRPLGSPFSTSFNQLCDGVHSSFQVLFVGGSKQDYWMSLTYCS